MEQMLREKGEGVRIKPTGRKISNADITRAVESEDQAVCDPNRQAFSKLAKE
jgi:hypothetical protein